MKKFLMCLVLAIAGINFATAQEWKEWEEHDIKAFYVEIDESEADEHWDAVEFSGRWFIPTRIPSGNYTVEVTDKVESKVWKFKGTKYFALFRYNPYLYRYDEGVLVSDGRSGTFYKKD